MTDPREPFETATPVEGATATDLDDARAEQRGAVDEAGRVEGADVRGGGVDPLPRVLVWADVVGMKAIDPRPELGFGIVAVVTRRLVDPEFVRTIMLVTVRGRPHSPAVGAFVQEARRYPWPASRMAGAAGDAISLRQQIMAVS